MLENSLKVKEQFQNDIQCPICLEGDFFEHDDDYALHNCGCLAHLGCLKGYIKQEFKGNNKLTINCLKCKAPIANYDIERIVPEVRQQILNTSLNQVVLNDPTLKPCLTPNCKGFGSFINEHKEFLCPICRAYICYPCKVLHFGQTCEQYKAEKQNEANAQERNYILELEKSGLFRICKKCQNGVEKSEGCHHMTCTCGHQFCNKCGADFVGVGKVCSCNWPH